MSSSNSHGAMMKGDERYKFTPTKSCKFRVEGQLMKYKGIPSDDVMTVMIGPASSASSASSYNEKSPKEMAESMGVRTKVDKEYLIVKVAPAIEDRYNHLGIGVKRTKKEKVVVTRIDDSSYAYGVLQIKDRLISINGKKIVDKVQCKQKILERNGEFEALVERSTSSKGVHLKKPLRSVDSYVFTQYLPPTTPIEDAELSDVMGTDPLVTIEDWEDVKARNNKISFQGRPHVTLESEVCIEPILSDVHPQHLLKKPNRNACLHG